MQKNEKAPCVDVLLSIIIPVYNVQDYLADCLDSAIGQDFPSFEIICVDDCSTDDTIRRVSELREKEPRIRLFQNKFNSGAAISRNNALR